MESRPRWSTSRRFSAASAAVASTGPPPSTAAKSRTRFKSLPATRGVPRDRAGDLGGAVAGEFHAQHPGGAAHDLLELGGVVEHQPERDAETLPQRAC